MEEVRLGTIGSGPIVHSVLDGVKAADGITLEAVYSRTEEKARELAAEYGANQVYVDLDEFLADSSVNTVYIATPNILHYGQVKKALEAGKHVICEKPFCTKADDAKELMELAEARNLFLVEAVPTTFLPNYEILCRQLEKVGRIRLVFGNYSQYSSRYDKLLAGELPNIFNPEFAGGCLMDINFYNVYLTVALFGRPEGAVYYPNLHKLGEGTSIDTSGTMVLQYGDFVSTAIGAKDTWGVGEFQIEGERGHIYIKDGSNGLKEIRVVTKDSDTTYNVQDSTDRWQYEIKALTALFLQDDHEAIRKRWKITLDTIRVVEAARKEAGIYFPDDIA